MAQLRLMPCLWFDDQAQEAAEFYVSVFENSRILRVQHYGEAGQEVHGRKPGSVMTVTYELDGLRVMNLNGGPLFKFNEAISLVVQCETQEEVDYYWENLTPGGDPKAQVCGWLKDRFGLSWQVTPTIMDKLMRDPPDAASERMFTAMMGMRKLDVAALQRAFDGG